MARASESENGSKGIFIHEKGGRWMGENAAAALSENSEGEGRGKRAAKSFCFGADTGGGEGEAKSRSRDFELVELYVRLWRLFRLLCAGPRATFPRFHIIHTIDTFN